MFLLFLPSKLYVNDRAGKSLKAVHFWKDYCAENCRKCAKKFVSNSLS